MPVAMPGAVLLIIAALLGSAGSEKPEDSKTVFKKLKITMLMRSIGWSGVKRTTTGLWGSEKVFSGVMNHASLSSSVMDESGFGECQENTTCQNA
ncbi:hypothetical protein PDJAM_G00083850 [Pangasius djambal]|uniref:Uncharacterized protein n=1 Tax=Pangasius djambal TaxID=1691987 RepID=A0ACC5Z409_9TELE|nr:hypothetical protein [Pangasius djambal]